jgi:hypothetical protein
VRDNLTYTPLHVSILRNKTPYLSIGSYYGLNDISNKKVSIKSIQYLLAHRADVNAIGGITDIHDSRETIAKRLDFSGVSAVSKTDYDRFEETPAWPEGTPMRFEKIRHQYDVSLVDLI